jgi:putative membrane protein insertion efficiency factor
MTSHPLVRLPQRAGVLAVRAYQLTISPWLGPCCRYEPSCSSYAAEAIRRHGLLRGTWLAAHRVARCHPLGASGFDPVP